MKAIILNIGNELLLGSTVNTNASNIAKILIPAGVEVDEVRMISDEEISLHTALNQLSPEIDRVIITGGLGPTPDDLTSEIIASWVGVELVLYDEAVEHMSEIFKENWTQVREVNMKQAYFPLGAKLLNNPRGTALGFSIEHASKIIYCTPGVPRECIAMVENEILPGMLKHQSLVQIQKEFYTFGLGESRQTQMFEGYQLPSGVHFASLPSISGLLVRLWQWVTPQEELKTRQIIQQISDEFRSRITNVFPEVMVGSFPLLQMVEQFLLTHQLTISIAESCTGGLLGYRLTQTPGSSKWFIGGVQSYSNEVKMAQLGVRSQSLDKYGSVSEEVAQEMALGVAQLMDTDTAISITGIAGPEGGNTEKPVGTVSFSVYYQGDLYTETKRLRGNREEIREKSVWTALDLFRRAVKIPSK